MKRVFIAGCLSLSLAACVQPYNGQPVSREIALSNQDGMAATEETDRIDRFRRLAAQYDVVTPTVTETVLPPGSVDFMKGSVPVVRVVFPEKAFFAFDSAVPLPQSERILDTIAENMKHDVPDAAMTVMGHTDAIGTDEYNVDLSRRRAQAVIQALVARGVSPAQLTEVAIGKRQPIAPNDQADGRALNRRVEFLISPAVSANLAAVQQVVVPQRYLNLASPTDVHAAQVEPVSPSAIEYAMVYGAKPSTPKGASLGSDAGLKPLGALKLSPTAADTLALNLPNESHSSLQSAQGVHLAPTMATRPVNLIKPEKVDLHQVQPASSTNLIY